MQYFFAGGEVWSNLLLDLGVRNQLMSYYYFRRQLQKEGHKARQLLSRMRLAKQKGYRFFLDSGAFTYQLGQRQKKAMVAPAAYFEDYFHFVLDHGDLFDVIAEFDVDGCKDENGKRLEVQQVDEWTNRLLDFATIRHRVMPVFRDQRGDRWLTDWLKDTSSPLIGYASSGTKGPSFIAKCHQWGKWVHGFGQSGFKTDLRYARYDSIDSSAWLNTDKFGNTYIFQNGKWTVLNHDQKAERRRFRRYFESWGLDFGKIMKDDLHELRVATIIAWREMSNYLELAAESRGGEKSKPYLWRLAQQQNPLPEVHPFVDYRRRKAD